MIENHPISRVGAKNDSALILNDLNSMIDYMVRNGKSATTVRYVLRIIHRVLDDAGLHPYDWTDMVRKVWQGQSIIERRKDPCHEESKKFQLRV